MEIIAHIHTDFTDKFGIPRQSGIAPDLKGKIIFEPKYRQREAFRGLEEYSHLWILWEFSESKRENWLATAKPPRLGGKIRMGVFATRSPFRPNPIGLSCVKLDKIEFDKELGPVLTVSGIDMLGGTPVYDIKPYLPYTDCHPEASAGFTETIPDRPLAVVLPDSLAALLPPDKIAALKEVLALDPRPGAKRGSPGAFAMYFAGYDVHFTVDGDRLSVTKITPPPEH